MLGSDLVIPFLLTTLAGLSTAAGSLVVFAVRKPGPVFLSFMLGMAAGVMILVSFVELLGSAVETVGLLPASLAFFGGMLLIFLIDILTPHSFMDEQQEGVVSHSHRLARTGTMVALGLAIHNFPEGLAVFASAVESPQLGIALAIAIAIHNIPEGIAVAVPIYSATGKRSKALLASLYSGLAEPLGALVGAPFLLALLAGDTLSYTLAAVGGIMVFISLDELIPSAHKVGDEHPIILGIVSGMIVMTVSLLLLQ